MARPYSTLRRPLAISTKRTAVIRRDADAAGLRTVQSSEAVIAVTEDVWQDVEIADEWIASYRLVRQGGAVVIGELRIYPNLEAESGEGEWRGSLKGVNATVPEGGLSSTIVRRARLGSDLVEVQRTIAWAAPEALKARRSGIHRNDPFSKEGIWGRLGVDDPQRVTSAPTRRAATLSKYAKAAQIYVEALKDGDPHPTKAVERRLGLDAPAARDRIHAARKSGLLLPEKLKRGQRQGRLSEAAIALLSRTKTRT